MHNYCWVETGQKSCFPTLFCWHRERERKAQQGGLFFAVLWVGKSRFPPYSVFSDTSVEVLGYLLYSLKVNIKWKSMLPTTALLVQMGVIPQFSFGVLLEQSSYCLSLSVLLGFSGDLARGRKLSLYPFCLLLLIFPAFWLLQQQILDIQDTKKAHLPFFSCVSRYLAILPFLLLLESSYVHFIYSNDQGLQLYFVGVIDKSTSKTPSFWKQKSLIPFAFKLEH